MGYKRIFALRNVESLLKRIWEPWKIVIHYEVFFCEKKRNLKGKTQ